MKIFSATISLLGIASVVLAANPRLAASVSTQTIFDPSLTQGTFAARDLDPEPDPGTVLPLPACNCPSNPTPTNYGPYVYNAGYQQGCYDADHNTPNRLGEYRKAVYTCPGGKMYVCSYTEGLGCTNSTTAKQTCPSNTCVGAF